MPNERRAGQSKASTHVHGIPHEAEGAARDSNNEFRNFLSIARSSLSELDTQIDLSYDLGLIPERLRPEIDRLLSRVDRTLYGLHKSKKLRVVKGS